MKSYPEPVVLLVDDEPSLLLALQTGFARQGWRVETASGLSQAKAQLGEHAFDLVVCDVRLRQESGFDLLPVVRRSPGTALLFLTAFATVPDAVRAIHGGAVDYLTKPVSFDQLFREARRILEQMARNTPHPVATTPPANPQPEFHPELFPHITLEAELLAREDVLLFEGEAGTGKRSFARFLHRQSRRRQGPYVVAECGPWDAERLELELFGEQRGAKGKTLSAGSLPLCPAAHGGTLILQNPRALTTSLFERLADVVSTGVLFSAGGEEALPADLRLIVCQEIRTGAPSSVLPASLISRKFFFPPLRSRPSQIAAFAEFFWSQLSSEPRTAPRQQLIEWAKQDWNGNLSELRAAVEEHASRRAAPLPFPALKTMQEIERSHLEATLAEVNGNRTHAAERLGISVRTMRNKIRQYDLSPRRYA